jgi:hypothetical protein
MVRSIKQISRRPTAAQSRTALPNPSKAAFDLSLELASDREVERFLASGFTVLAPKCFSYQPLRSFMELRHIWNHLASKSSSKRLGRTLLDHIKSLPDEDSCSPCGGEIQRLSSEDTLHSPSSGLFHVERTVLGDDELFDKLGVIVSSCTRYCQTQLKSDPE